jgi:hypothetical protein
MHILFLLQLSSNPNTGPSISSSYAIPPPPAPPAVSSSLASFPTHALAAVCVVVVRLLHLFLVQALLAGLKLTVRSLFLDFADLGPHCTGIVCFGGKGE